ncbi:MAG TPA: hypothetical protein ENK02_03890 [Planctomycetes bacterium]|nr:hypothetical protein [Planctomycetota bacterium]
MKETDPSVAELEITPTAFRKDRAITPGGVGGSQEFQGAVVAKNGIRTLNGCDLYRVRLKAFGGDAWRDYCIEAASQELQIPPVQVIAKSFPDLIMPLPRGQLLGCLF